jgi:hypothetical protein
MIPDPQVFPAFTPFTFEAGPLADGLAQCADVILSFPVGQITLCHGTPVFHRLSLMVTAGSAAFSGPRVSD